ncbi:uncharacterized protein SPSK_04655 [Sporothrix schenckii 1099-18]|uniref:Uncharacterized protein n=1 Tax=Sporothrix schenckii 1099-18 TaxID=1397361 RepID=A0A0F2M3J9_SPOSC|nr:uncharacterized protein SPSK_04655 [Sporothrix schenckii 1099-18]KJR83350.1 hypothetical protein SPSK_04655 [Sporothrix schenckii 1099-18]
MAPSDKGPSATGLNWNLPGPTRFEPPESSKHGDGEDMYFVKRDKPRKRNLFKLVYAGPATMREQTNTISTWQNTGQHTLSVQHTAYGHLVFMEVVDLVASAVSPRHAQ